MKEFRIKSHRKDFDMNTKGRKRKSTAVSRRRQLEGPSPAAGASPTQRGLTSGGATYAEGVALVPRVV